MSIISYAINTLDIILVNFSILQITYLPLVFSFLIIKIINIIKMQVILNMFQVNHNLHIIIFEIVLISMLYLVIILILTFILDLNVYLIEIQVIFISLFVRFMSLLELAYFIYYIFI